jgi:uncharacterized membrane protein
MKTQRLGWIDFLKGLAISAVFIDHSSSEFASIVPRGLTGSERTIYFGEFLCVFSR